MTKIIGMSSVRPGLRLKNKYAYLHMEAEIHGGSGLHCRIRCEQNFKVDQP